MRPANPLLTLSPRDYDAVLFDLDGVLTNTATVHAAAWKRLFDDFLRRHAASSNEPFVPFDSGADYLRYVDGKPRDEGVTSLLASRGIELPLDAPAAHPDAPSVHGLGKLKDDYFLENLEEQGVQSFGPSIDLLRQLRTQQVSTAVVSSSRNCAAVLEAAGIAEMFDARVDGNDLAGGRLAGKPAPDTFLEAARRLRVEPSRAVVFEDSIAGIEAARAGRFGRVIGVDRGGQAHALRAAGADVVVNSLGQVQVSVEPPSDWSLVFEEFEPEREGMREALCTLGNGYFGTRGAAAGAVADGTHYPGTYLAGGYNRMTTDIAGRVVENEDLVNLPNWLSLMFRVGDQDWFEERQVKLLTYRQELDLRHGMLLRRIRFEDVHGRISLLQERRLVSMADMHLGALELSLTAENWSGQVTVRSAIDGRVVNNGARLYRRFNNRHLETLQARVESDEAISLLVRTSQSRLEIAQAVRTQVMLDGKDLTPVRRTVQEPDYIAQEFTVDLVEGQVLVLQKLGALHTSRDHAISECMLAARKAITRAGGFDEVMSDHLYVFRRLWRRFDIHLVPADTGFTLNVLMLLRLNIFHLLQAVSPNSIGLDIGVPARGWTGEAYQGHIFWDELFIFPFFNHRMPEISRSLLMYRFRRLGEARAAARRAGLGGAMFPWQSGSDGQEETQELNLNPRSDRWVPDHSYLQRHVGSAIAYNVWQYFQVTQDFEFLQDHGAELILEIAKFWSSMARFNPARERFEICGVMGPDEFHDGYPDAPTPGLDNNAYTNVMAVWVLCRALDVLQAVSEINRIELMSRLELSAAEIERWDTISRRMFVPFQGNGIISQFEGYEKLQELDWEAYRARYLDIQRLDLILEAEGDSANRYKLSKQADVLMLFYVFSADEFGGLMKRLDYPVAEGDIQRNVAYYASRSSDGSTLSRVAMSWVLARSDRTGAMSCFTQALQSDVVDIQNGTTAEGVHLGAMAGTVDLMQRVTTGIEVTADVLRLNPRLPPELNRLDMRIRYRGHALDLRLTPDTLTVRGRNKGAAAITLSVRGRTCRFESGTTRVFRLKTKRARKASPSPPAPPVTRRSSPSEK